MHRIEHVDFQENLISNVVSKEGYALDERDMANVYRLPIVCVPSVGGGESVVDRSAEFEDVRVY
jgi:hypothetical protein